MPNIALPGWSPKALAERSAQRENDRELAYEPVAWLNAERFGALRVPLEHGGLGGSVEQLYDLLKDVGLHKYIGELRTHTHYILLILY